MTHPFQSTSPGTSSVVDRTTSLTLVETRTLAHEAAVLPAGSALSVGDVSYRLTKAEADALASMLSAATGVWKQAHTLEPHRVRDGRSLFLWSNGDDGWLIQPMCRVCEEVTGPALFMAKGNGCGEGKTRMFAEQNRAARIADKNHTECAGSAPLRADGTSTDFPVNSPTRLEALRRRQLSQAETPV